MKRTIAVLAVFTLIASAAWAVNLRLEWDANSEPDLAGYRVYQRVEGQAYDFTQPIDDIDDPGYLTSDLPPLPEDGKTYYWVVTAYDTSGNESGPSNEVSYKTKDSIPPAPPHCKSVGPIL